MSTRRRKLFRLYRQGKHSHRRRTCDAASASEDEADGVSTVAADARFSVGSSDTLAPFVAKNCDDPSTWSCFGNVSSCVFSGAFTESEFVVFASCSGLEGLVGCHQRLRSLLAASACALLYAVSALADRRMSVLPPKALIF